MNHPAPPGARRPAFRRVLIAPEALDYAYTDKLLSRLSTLGDGAVEVTRQREGEPPPRGKSTLFVTVRRGAFMKPCPCTPGAVRCGYYVFTPLLGCPYACSYCFLRFYAPDEPLTVYANLEDAAAEFKEKVSNIEHPIRVGTGEFADSLALEPWTGHAEWLSELIAPYPHVLLELKTKSDNAAALLDTPELPNLIGAWSVNPPELAASEEPGTAPIEARIGAAASVADAGRPVAFHFDPIIARPGWEAGYRALIGKLFDSVPTGLIRWISLGTLRFPKRFLDTWGPRLAGNAIFFDEFVAGEDGKLRYFWPQRRDVYARMKEMIGERSGGETPVYLCMESEAMWDASMGGAPAEEELEARLSSGEQRPGAFVPERYRFK